MQSAEDLARVLPHLRPTLPDGRYLHWDDLRRRPAPEGLSRAQGWLAQKLARAGSRVEIPGFTDEQGRSFWFCRLDALDRATHQIDRRDVARELLATMGDIGAQSAYRVDQLIEEAISSSLIEGARLTTRAQAKAIVLDGRNPSSRGEHMVVNNYRAMKLLLDRAHGRITLGDLLEIHAVLGENALDVPDVEGRLRTTSDAVRVEDAVTGDVWFTPPPAAKLDERLASFFAFANDDGSATFLHPLVRAIVLHFWLAYLHPFVDGNGRMARALFYWQMLRADYDFAQYLSISGPIDRSRRGYYRAFVLSETDEGDLTYFLLHQLSVLQRATNDLAKHLRERGARLHQMSHALEASDALNARQRAVLLHLIRNPRPGATIAGHATAHSVTYLTARRDLQELEQQGLLRRLTAGKTHEYVTTDQVRRALAL